VTQTDHCPNCASHRTDLTSSRCHGEETVTTWRCRRCRHRWTTSYLTAAYGESAPDTGNGPQLWDWGLDWPRAS
jgi:hypothetical protein